MVKSFTAPKRILILAATHEPYDNRVYYKETLSLLKQYPEITLITPAGKDFQPAEGVSLERFKAESRWGRIRKLYQTARGKKIDLCHCHEPDSLLAGVWLKKETGCKLIYDSHEYHPESFSERFPVQIQGLVRWAMLRFERWMVRYCDYVITVNEDLATKFKGWGAKVAVLPNYPSPELFAEKFALEIDLAKLGLEHEGISMGKVLHLTYVGTLAKTRGVLDVLEVARQLQNDGESVKVSIIGLSNEPEFTEELKKFSREHRLNVDFVGHVPHDQVAQRMKESDVGLLLLHPLERYMKAEPIKLFEYMACSLPVLSYRYPAVEGIIAESQCGVMVNPLDLKSVVATLKIWIHDPEIRRCLGKNGENAFRQKYNWSVCERRLWQVYEELGLE